MKYCRCGCGSRVARNYVKGHNLNGRTVLADRVIGAYYFLRLKYGTWKKVAEVCRISVSTIEKHLHNPECRVSADTYQKINNVMSLYKNKHKPRPIEDTPEI